MELLEMILIPIISLFILFVLTKMMGYRQVSQLSMYDYIVGITFGSIAGEFVMSGTKDYLRPIIAMIMYTLFAILLSKLAQMNPFARKIIDGQAVILYENDCLYNKELEKAKIDIDEFLMQCRIGGYFNLLELDTIVLETNGNLSFFPKEKNRPIQVNDLDIKIQEIHPPKVLVKQGLANEKNIEAIHKDRKWLENTLKNANVKMQDVVLMYQEDNSNIQLFTSNIKEKKYD